MDRNTVGCVNGGGVIETFSGRMFDVLHPTPEQVHLPDIAHALSMICRFNGHCSEFYSVASHCVYVERHLQASVGDKWEWLLAALLHDASEAYLCDLARPVKVSVAGYDRIEAAVQSAVFRHYGIAVTPEMHAAIKRSDNALCRAEAWWLMHSRGKTWGWGDTVMPNTRIEPASPEQSKVSFLTRVTYVWSKLKLERSAAA